MKSYDSGKFYIKNSVICTADTIISRYRSFGFFDEKTILIKIFWAKSQSSCKRILFN